MSRVLAPRMMLLILALVFGHSAFADEPAAKKPAADPSAEQLFGDGKVKAGGEKADKAALFRDGNYGLFMHWGLYSHLGGKWHDKTFYGIGEWIKRQMQISEADYMAEAKNFNPSEFDAKEIARVAKEAGMKWIIITSKHHEGFAMFKSQHPFNIVDATPFKRDPMKELAAACKEAGLGFGFYYSHNQDWTAPGGSGGPGTNADGSKASFEQYFREKCFPQVKEICTQYGPLNYIWFDTPGGMRKPLVKELAALVRETQPQAMLCSRIGHGMGDYESKGDMEVPPRNMGGLWETCDTTNDSWSFAWYDQNWKDSKEILHRLVSTVGRGGTYLLNVGPDGKGRIPPQAAQYLVKAGEWIKTYPEVVYGAGPSPFGHALAWGDATTQGNTLHLVVFDLPNDGYIWLPGLQTEISEAAVLMYSTKGMKSRPVTWEKVGAWTGVRVGPSGDRPATVVQGKLKDVPKADATLGIYPNIAATLPVEFAEIDVKDADHKRIAWMEKFGEWKFATQASDWKNAAKASWQVDVAKAGDYRIELIYKGEGRVVWKIETDEGVSLQNQQNASAVYHAYPYGVLTFKKPGKHTITVSFVEGNRKASLESVRLTPTE